MTTSTTLNIWTHVRHSVHQLSHPLCLVLRPLTRTSCALLLVSVFFAAWSAWATPASAAMSPSDTLRNGIDHVLMTLKNPDYRDPEKRAPLRHEIEREIEQLFDFAEFSRRTLGSYWADFTPDQQARFQKVFAQLMISTYLDKVDGYNGEKVVYLGERFTQNNKLAEVQTTISFSNGQIVPVAYRMLDKNGTWRIYDVMVESVSLNSNYRAQFKDILTNTSPDVLISRIQTRVEELKRLPHQPS